MKVSLRRGLLVILFFLLAVFAGFAQQRFPFTREENLDGAKFVWFVYNLSGFSFGYTPTKSLPSSGRFVKLAGAHPQESDIAWWDRFMGLYSGDSARTVMTAEGNVPLATLVKKYGPVQWYSYLHGIPETIGLRIFGGRLSFTIPDSTIWKQKDQQFNQNAQKGLIMFERDSLIDAEGTEVQPIMSVIYQPLPPGITDAAMFAESSLRPEGMTVVFVDTVENSLLYHCRYNNGADHTVLILYMVGPDAGISVVCDATTAVYDPVRHEFLSFLQSVRYERQPTK